MNSEAVLSLKIYCVHLKQFVQLQCINRNNQLRHLPIFLYQKVQQNQLHFISINLKMDKFAKSNVKQPSIIPPKQKKDDKLYTDQLMCCEDLLYDVSKQEMNHKIHKLHVAIVWKIPTGIGRGTGLMISSNLVLTSAHNFYHNSQRIENHFINLYPSQCGPLTQPFQIEQIYIPQGYQNQPYNYNVYYDFALVKIKAKVRLNDFIELRSDFKKQTTKYKIGIFGYPAVNYKKISLMSNTESVFQSGLVLENKIDDICDKEAKIFHTLSTQPGQSGASIILIQQVYGQQIYCVIGIHKGGCNKKNIGRLMTSQLINELHREAQKMGAEMFRSNNNNGIHQNGSPSAEKQKQIVENIKQTNFYTSAVFQSSDGSEEQEEADISAEDSISEEQFEFESKNAEQIQVQDDSEEQQELQVSQKSQEQQESQESQEDLQGSQDQLQGSQEQYQQMLESQQQLQKSQQQYDSGEQVSGWNSN